MNTIKLKDFSKSLVLRKQWIPIRKLASRSGYKVIFDLSWIDFMTSSVADEIFAKWFKKFWNVFVIKGVKDTYMKELIKSVIFSRHQVAY